MNQRSIADKRDARVIYFCVPIVHKIITSLGNAYVV